MYGRTHIENSLTMDAYRRRYVILDTNLSKGAWIST